MENNLLCLVTNGEGKRHKIFILEGRGLIKSWDMLVAKLTELGIKGKTEERRDAVGNKELLATQERRVIEDKNEGNLLWGRSFVEVTKEERNRSPNMIWVDAGECLPREAMGNLKFCLVGRWENPHDTYPMDLEFEAWARTTWARNRNSALSKTSDFSVPKLILPTMPPGKMRILFTSIF